MSNYVEEIVEAIKSELIDSGIYQKWPGWMGWHERVLHNWALLVLAKGTEIRSIDLYNGWAVFVSGNELSTEPVVPLHRASQDMIQRVVQSRPAVLAVARKNLGHPQ